MVNLAISEALYARHPDDDEGYLSARRAAIVSTTGPRPAGRPDRPRLVPPAGRRRGAAQRTPPAVPARVDVRGCRRGALSRPRLRDGAATGSSGWPRPSSSPRRRSARSRAPRAGSRSTPSVGPATDRPTSWSTRPGPDHEKSFRIEVWVDGEMLGDGRRTVASRGRDSRRGPGAGPAASDDVSAGRRARRRRRMTLPDRPAEPRLLALRLQGFKSFAERTSVEFGPGISAVVGPNGSGKSNLADALRWALGEQGRALRSRKSEDVIWAGSEKRAAQGMADVTLVLDNADGLLPVEFGVLELGRRLYRSGENDYLLNKSRIRLRDLVDLLDSAHLADNAFLFIGQGMVDQALALRPGGAPAAVRGGRRRPASRAPSAPRRGAARRIRGEPGPGRGHPRRAPAAGPPAGRPGRAAGDARVHRGRADERPAGRDAHPLARGRGPAGRRRCGPRRGGRCGRRRR